jgi:hypothetical protein
MAAGMQGQMGLGAELSAQGRSFCAPLSTVRGKVSSEEDGPWPRGAGMAPGGVIRRIGRSDGYPSLRSGLSWEAP